jgi:peptidoglycan biosynthesis protein MviN/MurJ (putative lipid II flippase)
MLHSVKTYYANFYRRNYRAAIVVMMLFVLAIASSAQTAIPVDIDVPVEDMISYLNQWIGVLAPIVLFLGMIPVAMGLLRYLTKLFQSAFSGGS